MKLIDSRVGNNFQQYPNSVIRKSSIGDNVIVGDNAFITDSDLGAFCTIERRAMIFNTNFGDYSYCGPNTVIKYSTIGKFSSISWNCSIGGANHYINRLTTHPFPFSSKFGICKDDSTRGIEYESFSNDLDVGNDVWLGSNVCILRNVNIGDGAIVGAGAVVTRDIAPYEIWAGVPAKKIGQRFSDEIISELVRLPWWNLSKELLTDHLQLFSENIDMEIVNGSFRSYK